jgi:hypothetical protein
MKVSGSAQRRTATFVPESLEVTEKVFIFADENLMKRRYGAENYS